MLSCAANTRSEGGIGDSQRTGTDCAWHGRDRQAILAADASSGTINQRFDALKLESTEEHRRTYRAMLFTTPDAAAPINAVNWLGVIDIGAVSGTKHRSDRPTRSPHGWRPLDLAMRRRQGFRSGQSIPPAGAAPRIPAVHRAEAERQSRRPAAGGRDLTALVTDRPADAAFGAESLGRSARGPRQGLARTRIPGRLSSRLSWPA